MTFPVVEPPGYVTGEAWRGEYYETRQYPSGPEEKLEWERLK